MTFPELTEAITNTEASVRQIDFLVVALFIERICHLAVGFIRWAGGTKE